MYIRQASLNDKEKWDSFIDLQNGSFFHYFNWKYIYELRGENYIPLIIENELSEIIGILPIVIKKSNYYSSIESLPEGAFGGFVLKNDLSILERNKAINLFLNYVDKNFTRNCSRIELKENVLLNEKYLIKPNEILIKHGFKYIYDSEYELPCTYILKLKQPFENNIWNELWDHRLKNKIKKSRKKGVTILEDKNLKYFNDFFNMFTHTQLRLGTHSLSKDEILKRLTIFPNKTKLFIALLNEEPLAAILCYYKPSICYLSKLPSYEKAREYDANTLLASEAIKNACENSYKYCDLGVTLFPGQTRWKEQFKGIKVPLKIYKKRYSIIRTAIEKISPDIQWIWNNKRYIWRNPRILIKKVIKRK